MIFIQSSAKPMRAQPRAIDQHRERGHRELAEDEEGHQHGQPDEHAAHGGRALLGLVALGPSSRMVWPNSLRRSHSMNARPHDQDDDHRGDAGGQGGEHQRPPSSRRSRSPLPVAGLAVLGRGGHVREAARGSAPAAPGSPRRPARGAAAREALTSTALPGAIASGSAAMHSSTVAIPGAVVGLAEVVARQGADGQRRARPLARRTGRPRGGRRRRPEPSSNMSPSTATRRPLAGHGAEVVDARPSWTAGWRCRCRSAAGRRRAAPRCGRAGPRTPRGARRAWPPRGCSRGR